MSQIEKKNQEFVKTNSHVLEDTTNQEFGYWKSLKDISSEDDYNRFLKQSEHNVDNGLSRRNFLSLIAASVALADISESPASLCFVPKNSGKTPTLPSASSRMNDASSRSSLIFRMIASVVLFLLYTGGSHVWSGLVWSGLFWSEQIWLPTFANRTKMWGVLGF